MAKVNSNPDIGRLEQTLYQSADGSKDAIEIQCPQNNTAPSYS
ncbi:hypothetical protein PZE06_22300 [Robertmurraya sp. DFI.2.37]|nr:hypothetical protein [Robertmurraya sp. DFI.2.37]MDF1510869.1 hypothetical protein [Robertmurraya sp. DFI.2.37]